MICGMTIGFLLIVGLVILVAGMGAGALIAIVGIDAQRKLEDGKQERLERALNGFVWLGNNLHNIKADPDKFESFYLAALEDAQKAKA